jgi:hypothetical protein
MSSTPPPQAGIQEEQVRIEQRSDGAIVVRVRSSGEGDARLPDAVFAFRCGDPQYAYWLQRLKCPGDSKR